jgi:hypothetical protein
MQNDSGAPGAPPSRGFASIITLVSDVSKDLEALEQASAAAPPPEAPRPPQPVRIGPAPGSGPLFGSVTTEKDASNEGPPAWPYIAGGLALLVMMIRCLGG